MSTLPEPGTPLALSRSEGLRTVSKRGRRGTLAAIFAILLVLACAAIPAAAKWSVISASWRPDENPWAKQQVWDGWYWAEGWSNPEQFFPKYFQPAGSIHVILRNDSSQPASLKLEDLDGERNILTDLNTAGRVVWRSFFPRETTPGEWAECILRLRQRPTKDVKVGLMSGNERVDVTVPVKPSRVRLESLSFSPNIDRLYIYLRGLDGSLPKPGGVRLDQGQKISCKWTPGPKGSGLVLAEVALKPAWQLGSYHLVQVFLADGSSLAYPVRAWDNFFMIGLFGSDDITHVREAKARGINTYVHPRDTAMMDSLGINYVPGWAGGKGRTRIPGKQSGNVVYYNLDEPDGADTGASKTLPYMDRLGLMAQREVLPRFWEQYDADPATPALLLVNNTYKPLNYYVYGQCVDVFCSDPYVPLGGDQCEYIAHAMECVRDASAPCPTVATLWCTYMRNRPGAQFRPPTPEEERLMAFYAVGAGAKGIFYFADRDTPTGEELEGVFHNRPLWDEMGRINHDIATLAPYLSIGCPIGEPKETDKVWYRTIMCGPKTMVLIVVNKGHHIGYNTQKGFAWNFPARDAQVPVRLPAQFNKCRIQEVSGGKLHSFGSEIKGNEFALKMDTINTARAFVITPTE
jgi:hypothetical protein